MDERDWRLIRWGLGIVVLLAAVDLAQAIERPNGARRGFRKLVHPVRLGSLLRPRSTLRPGPLWRRPQTRPARRLSVDARFRDKPAEDVSAYPKYIGGFHSRYFNEYGLPPGDYGAWPRPW